jgi:hypothetical protein
VTSVEHREDLRLVAHVSKHVLDLRLAGGIRSSARATRGLLKKERHHEAGERVAVNAVVDCKLGDKVNVAR